MSTFDKLVNFVDNSKLKYVPVGATEFVDLMSQVWNGGFQQYILNDYHSDVGSVIHFLKKIKGKASEKLINIIDRVDFDRISIDDVYEDEELEEILEEMTDSFYEIDKAVVDEVYQHLTKDKVEAKTKFANIFLLGAAAFERFKNKSQYDFEKSDDDRTLVLIYDGNKHIATFDTNSGFVMTDLDKKIFANTESLSKSQKAKLLDENWDLITAVEILEDIKYAGVSKDLKLELSKLPSENIKDLEKWSFDKLSLESQVELWDILDKHMPLDDDDDNTGDVLFS